MNESKPDTPIDLARIDAHVISEREYEEIPELTDEDFARGVWMPGRQSNPTTAATRDLQVDADVLARFQATGPGWEELIRRILRDAAKELETF